MSDKKLLFLFGAGASHGCDCVIPPKPPLGKDLFNHLLNDESLRFWRDYSQRFPDSIKEEFELNFESAFSKLVRLYSDETYKIVMLQHLQVELADYLFKFDIPNNFSTNNYFRLIKILQNNNLLYQSNFSSLNYDCIFEKILVAMKIKYCNYLGNVGEIYNEKIKLFKPHGSSNYIIKRRNFDVQVASFSPAISLDFPIEAINFKTFAEINKMEHRSNLWPIMSLYNFEKENRICFTSLKNIRKKLDYTIHKATHIILIGVRYVENDTHIWSPINKSKGKLIYFGDDLTGFQRKKNVYIINEHFDKSCESFMQYL